MLFNDFYFVLIFLPAVVFLYSILPFKRLVLIAASFFFYGYFSPENILILSASIVFNYLLSSLIVREAKAVTKKLLLATAVLGNIVALSYYKYSHFLVDNLSALLSESFSVTQIVLPLAISFFTFQQIAYVVDSYKYGEQSKEFTDYVLFVVFFPQLIAGPIVHHREMMPQFAVKRSAFDMGGFSLAVLLFSIGLLKKTYADYLAWVPDEVYQDVSDVGFFQSWMAALGYSMQLYFDFSGYADMAIGAAAMFGIKLPENFNSPYQAANIREFWHRWHMTLSRWLREYLYIPLGGSRSSSIATAVNLILTFLLGGLWHGAGWTFIVWGAMHGSAVVFYSYFLKYINIPSMFKFVSVASTFIFVTIAWVFFRAESVADAVSVISQMSYINAASIDFDWITEHYFYGLIILLSLVMVFFFPNSHKIVLMVEKKGFKFPVWSISLPVLAILITIFRNNDDVISPFLYFNF